MVKELPARHFVDEAGRYIGKFVSQQKPDTPIFSEPKIIRDEDGKETIVKPVITGYAPGEILESLPEDPNAIEVPGPPAHGRDTWDRSAGEWVSCVKPIKDLDQEMAERDDITQALLELVPGGAAAVKAKATEIRNNRVGNPPRKKS